jgi:hypothetical protein
VLTGSIHFRPRFSRLGLTAASFALQKVHAHFSPRTEKVTRNGVAADLGIHVGIEDECAFSLTLQAEPLRSSLLASQLPTQSAFRETKFAETKSKFVAE